jgi:hypothetical protein
MRTPNMTTHTTWHLANNHPNINSLNIPSNIIRLRMFLTTFIIMPSCRTGMWTRRITVVRLSRTGGLNRDWTAWWTSETNMMMATKSPKSSTTIEKVMRAGWSRGSKRKFRPCCCRSIATMLTCISTKWPSMSFRRVSTIFSLSTGKYTGSCRVSPTATRNSSTGLTLP